MPIYSLAVSNSAQLSQKIATLAHSWAYSEKKNMLILYLEVLLAELSSDFFRNTLKKDTQITIICCLIQWIINPNVLYSYVFMILFRKYGINKLQKYHLKVQAMISHILSPHTSNKIFIHSKTTTTKSTWFGVKNSVSSCVAFGNLLNDFKYPTTMYVSF